MSNNLQEGAITQVVIIPKAELDMIKDALKEVRDTLKTKSAEEMNNKWVDSKEAAKFLKVSLRTLGYMRKQGFIPFSQFKRKIVIKRADLEAFVANHSITKGGR